MLFAVKWVIFGGDVRLLLVQSVCKRSVRQVLFTILNLIANNNSVCVCVFSLGLLNFGNKFSA
jgi:hypothetical protein